MVTCFIAKTFYLPNKSCINTITVFWNEHVLFNSHFFSDFWFCYTDLFITQIFTLGKIGTVMGFALSFLKTCSPTMSMWQHKKTYGWYSAALFSFHPSALFVAYPVVCAPFQHIIYYNGLFSDSGL